MSEKPKVVFLDRDAFTVDLVPRTVDVACEWVEHSDTAPHEVAARIETADVVITNGVTLDRAALEGARNLRLVSAASTGVDHIDTEYCKEAGITVHAVAEYASAAVAEHTFMLMLALRRSLGGYIRDVQDGAWQRSGQFSLPVHRIDDLDGACLAVVGAGAIGRSVARIASAFGMNVIMSERKGAESVRDGRVGFDEALRACDVLSLHCPLDGATHHMIGAREFAIMEKAPLLINCARGALVDEAALAEALISGRLRGAGLDVSDREPPAPGSPLTALVGRDDFILTPHVGWASRQAQQSLYDQAVDAALQFIRRDAGASS